MLIVAALIAIAPLSPQPLISPIMSFETAYTKKKKRTASSGSGKRFSSCVAARKAGFTHMRRGQAGYSKNLDRDGDGVACDKEKNK
jgi:Excalibur calcium-binding domain